MLLISYYDIKERKIYNYILIILILFRSCFFLLNYVLFHSNVSIKESVIAACFAFLLFFTMKIAHSSGIGMGDVKLVFVLGLYLGYSVFSVILVSMFCLFLFGMIRKEKQQQELPFAPFLLLAMLLT